MIDVRRFAVLAASLLLSAGGADATIRANGGFRFAAGKPVKIIVLYPDVEVGSIGIGGVEEANADWTATARAALASQIEAQQRAAGNEVIFLARQEGEQARVVADYEALFRIVAQEAATHQMMHGNALPTKRDRFEWTLGPGAAQLGAIGGGDYALFVKTRDSFGTGGRKAFRLLTGGLARALVQGSGVHRSYAALIDLRSGDIVWLNADPAAGGDPRTVAGATKRVAQLFNGFPARSAGHAVAAPR